MAHAVALQIDYEALYLPLERWVRTTLLRGSAWTLLLWEVFGLSLCSGIILWTLHGHLLLFLHLYAAPVFIGVTATNLDILGILEVSRLLRSKIPKLIALLPSESARLYSMHELKHLVYSRKNVIGWGFTTLVLGEATFTLLGIGMPSRLTKALTFVDVGLIFVLLGVFIGIAVGFWRWMHRFGKRKPHIDVLHPDRMGGLKAIADVSDRVTLMGAILVALYTAGAYFSPYRHVEWRAYSYGWVVLASALLVMAYFLPALSVYRSFRAAHDRLGEELARHTERLYSLISRGQPDNRELEATLIASLWFGELLKKVSLWPYGETAFKLAAILLIEAIPAAIHHFLK